MIVGSKHVAVRHRIRRHAFQAIKHQQNYPWSSAGRRHLSTDLTHELHRPLSLAQGGEAILRESSPNKKVVQSFHVQTLWRTTSLPLMHTQTWSATPPDFPSRPPLPRLYDPKDMPSEKEFPIPIAILHALAHIELGAVDNYWDTVVRFEPSQCDGLCTLPRDFYDDFVNVACDEARHFDLVRRRLEELGSFYGQLPAHRALLSHANNTQNSLASRLAVIPLVQEARGLDAGPRLVHKLKSMGDSVSADVVAQIVFEERGHVSCGMKWFKHLCAATGRDPVAYFHELVKENFPDGLPGPFDLEARLAANMDPAWFQPLEMQKKPTHHQPPPLATTSPSTATPRTKKNGWTVLVAGSVWPERTSSAAGVRTADMIGILLDEGYNVVCISPSRLNSHANLLTEMGATCVQVDPNTDTFASVMASLPIHVAIFDRYIAEEMYGWHVAKHSPHAVRVLDLQDVHFLRKAREFHVCTTKADFRTALDPSIDVEPVVSVVLRELACILRSDWTVYVSDFEIELLVHRFDVPRHHLRKLDYIVRPDKLLQYSSNFHDRRHIAVVGSFKHSPNVDGLHWLKDSLWPSIRQSVHPDTELHIYGSYASAKATKALERGHDNIRVMGFCNDVHDTLACYRLSLAPLRFGAGIKGKIIDSWVAGTPVVSTSVGAEGMNYLPGKWGGAVADTPREFADRVANLYNDAETWKAAHDLGKTLCQTHYDFNAQKQNLLNIVSSGQQTNWVGRVLWSNQFRASEFMSRYIQEKNKNKAAE
ncbi:hypothetical protein H310_13063 [Aphanomyces invadans]|uniref:DUF455 domain-containing protein n=1 Tax=Aphanomyces invadans TaxID=157072 RepID=A0A024TEY9_9STRA|nr:hypothetical protein H310_13063 [Aphanomyces invadans]ETV92608.1 hypothetical protein H310_13063 [Aphanomyces invadans]|eukprot:XP_008878644.1 hypothetical protein H310_13063 [Aphanomyces invadans]